jgi:hypothetical protein
VTVGADRRPRRRRDRITARAAATLAIALASGAAGAPDARAAGHHAPAPPQAPEGVEAPGAPAEEPDELTHQNALYRDFKETLHTDYGLDYRVDLTVLPQWTAAKGGEPVGNFIYSPTVAWRPFTDTAAGSGAFVISYFGNTFWTKHDVASVSSRVGLLSPPSDWFSDLSNLAQLTYTHTLPGAWSWLSVSAGQYSFGIYDDNRYAGNSQGRFENDAAQNATQTYTNGDLGAFAQITAPDRQWLVAGGFQGADNVNGVGVSSRGLESGRIATFAAGRITPRGLGGSYGLLWYQQPAVPAQPSRSVGLSFSGEQILIAHWTGYLRANTASGAANAIRTSVAGGVVRDDPFGRERPDQLGFGLAWNKTNHAALMQPAHAAELVLETFFNYALFDRLKIGPDLQLYDHPALAPGSSTAVVFTLRATASF